MNLMIVISLLAASLAMMVLVHAVRHATEGHEDALGFHADAKRTRSDNAKTRSPRKRRTAVARAFGTHPAVGAR